LCLCYNYLSELPLSMHRLSGLKVLCLSGNYFDEVPEVIRFLKLKKLDLSGNQITELPSWFAKWVAENGTCVELGGNPITSQKIELINEEIAEVE
ncbi:hypothetical protein KAU11_02840, partial [Candidatus Babeliales bacterium]|nr:hypothetical protein [Candidatus Babeliales bacterium]